MGIPSYFSHIVKNHRKIIKKYSKGELKIDNLYLDSNSIIYDVIREINASIDDEKIIMREICKKIIKYIEILSPTQRIYIAFDGVAPLAKLEQQRTRRYKGEFQRDILQEFESTANNVERKDAGSFDTVLITPGTLFMRKLSNYMIQHFKNPSHYDVDKIIVSTSNEPGEGEHKIYEYIREHKNYHYNTTTVIYGLDADLIMLTLNHLHISNNLYLFRETPHFIKSIDKSLDPNENYLLDIPVLACEVCNRLSNNKEVDQSARYRVIRDYIFICFMLGNDFMPHFPALNIRTNGIDYILNAYANVCKGKKQYLTESNHNNTSIKIIWSNVKKLMCLLSENEHDYIKTEYRLRRRQRENIIFKTYEDKINSLPLIDYSSEEYINPSEFGWKERYYQELFNIDIDENIKKSISINYLEGLEWTLAYYTTGCKNWRWRYKYHYPPLLTDLKRYIPFFDTEFVMYKKQNPVKPVIQLAYVLPRMKLHYISHEIKQKLIEKFPNSYQENLPLKYAFCRYLWESHVEFPTLHIDNLEKIL